MIAQASRRWFVPEYIQASVMDCGPTALKSAFAGFGLELDYAQLREACQVQLDGTSIDTLEAVASELGMDAQQRLIPIDHLDAQALPALAVVVQPNGTTHFVVLWREQIGRVQVMDPARGRVFLTRAQLDEALYVHRQSVPAQAFRTFATSAAFSDPLRARLERAVPRATAAALLQAATEDPSWRSLAALDACTRAVDALARAGVLRSAAERERVLLQYFYQHKRAAAPSAEVPVRYWYAAAAPGSAPAGAAELVSLTGVVVLRLARSSRAARFESARAPSQPLLLTAAAPERAASPGRALLGLLSRDGVGRLILLALGAALAAAAALFEGVIWRAQLELDAFLGVAAQRSLAALAALCFMALLAALEFGIAHATIGVGRRLEARLRIAFMLKIPRLHDRFFQSRSVSDLAERSHMVHAVRTLPGAAIALLRSLCGFAGTACGLVWLDPSSAARVWVATSCSLIIPLLMQGTLSERDARLRAHSATLARSGFDALSGLGMIRAHAGDAALRNGYEAQLQAWKRESLGFMRAGVGLEALLTACATALTGWLFLGYIAHVDEPAGALLYLYWAATFPGYGRELAGHARQLPGLRNVLARLLEPLGALEATAPEPLAAVSGGAVRIECSNATLQAGGHVLLSELDLQVAAGEHVAIVGTSGAGKSSLIGLLLGFHRATSGRVSIDGAPLAEVLAGLRERTAWLDPAVHLWNRSLYENLRYGQSQPETSVQRATEIAELTPLLAALPDGLQSSLGEAGTRLSGGEQQRVRFGRALARSDADLVLLDEPFRGLDRAARSRLLARARQHWARATLLCVTHDLSETRDFARVLVLDGGRIVEDGAPAELAAQPESRYATLLRAELELLQGLRRDPSWRRLWLQDARLTERSVARSESSRVPSAAARHAELERGAAE